MKKLKRILLINWLYFDKQLIDVDDVNFLTGENGAGKSTLIDALQIVLLGETNARNFNQAANERSQRTVDGYLRADMDENNPRSRRGKDFRSYIACEFSDDIEGTCFVSGIVFDSRSDGSRQERFFSYNGRIPESCFLENREAMDIPSLRAYLKTQYGISAKVYDTHKTYREDMLAKWNIQNEQIFRMLKKAVSFRPIVDIQQFITENICDIPDKPDIEAMQQNIRDYKRDEKLALRQEEKLDALREIDRAYHDWQTAVERLQLHQFLIHWAKKEACSENIQKFEVEEKGLQEANEELEAQDTQIRQQLEKKKRKKEEFSEQLRTSDIFNEHKHLQEQKERCEKESRQTQERMQRTALDIRSEVHRLQSLCRRMETWAQQEDTAPLLEQIPLLQRACSFFANCDENIFVQPLAHFEHAQRAVSDFSNTLRESFFHISKALSALQEDQDKKKKVLSDLKRNVKDYPDGLLALKEHLQTELSKQFKSLSIVILADVLEIVEGEEQWRGAVEGYLSTQKFYLLVSPEAYPKALQLYDQIKHTYPRSFGLVDIGRLRENERIVPLNDSLATKVSTENPLARSYIDYLLGRVICCHSAEELRRHKTSITADGMLYQGYVARPISKERMNDVFIGQKAIALRISQIQAELRCLETEINDLHPVYHDLHIQSKKESLFTEHFIQNDVLQRQQDHLRVLEIQKELSEIDERISHLDLLWIDRIKQKLEQLEKEIAGLEQEKETCLKNKVRNEERIRALEYEVLPERYQELQEEEDLLAEIFSETFQTSIGLPRYRQELVRLKRASVIAQNFSGHLSQTQTEASDAQKKLYDQRTEYVRRFQPCSFRIDAADNEEFSNERRILEESELPKYREKIQKAHASALEQFQNDFLAKLKSSIDQVEEQVKNLNKALRNAQFGTDRYQFSVKRNPDYASYYDMIMDPALMEGEGGLFAATFQQKYGELIEELFSRITASDDTQLNARKQSELEENIKRYTDFRTYLKFDLETTDENGNKQLLSQTLNTKSGGETQTPFYIAVLASFAQLYQVNNPSAAANNTVRLVVFDEAFNKMDSNRIVESVRLLRKMGLQAIICTPPDKIADIAPIADRTLIVSKEQYRMHILPYAKEVLAE